MYYTSRKARTRKKLYKNKKQQLRFIANLWMVYLIFLIFIPTTDNTFSYFNDIESFSNSLEAADNFCLDEEYAKTHKKECKCNENSGFGNKNECGESGIEPDNPGGNEEKKGCPPEGCNDDHPKKPKNP